MAYSIAGALVVMGSLLGQSPSGDQLPGGAVGLAQVLADDAVQAELSLTEDQQQMAREVSHQLRQVRDGKAQTMAASRIRKSLTEKQFQRLQQIHWQRLGGRALFEKPVREQLNIRAEQAKQLQDARATNEAEHRKMLDFLKRARFRSAEALRAYKQKYFDAADKRLLETLSPQQRVILVTLLGDAFAPDE